MGRAEGRRLAPALPHLAVRRPRPAPDAGGRPLVPRRRGRGLGGWRRPGPSRRSPGSSNGTWPVEDQVAALPTWGDVLAGVVDDVVRSEGTGQELKPLAIS